MNTFKIGDRVACYSASKETTFRLKGTVGHIRGNFVEVEMDEKYCFYSYHYKQLRLLKRKPKLIRKLGMIEIKNAVFVNSARTIWNSPVGSATVDGLNLHEFLKTLGFRI